MARILTKKDWELIEKRKQGDHSDPTGQFSNRTKPKIVEVLRLTDEHRPLFRWLIKPKKAGEKFRGEKYG